MHAKLAPSASDRWLECPASIRMESILIADGVEQESSIYADEGTCAHELGELKARYLLVKDITERIYTRRLQKWRMKWSQFTGEEPEVEEFHRHTDAYVDLLRERLNLYPNSVLMLEKRLDTGVPQCDGTSDAVIVSPRHVEIVDFKYGQGVEVQADGNSQLRLYALGALDTYGDILGDTEIVRSTVHQPRLDHVLTEELTPDQLRAWRSDVVIPTAEEALGDDAHFGPSETACRWCPASGRCKAQLEQVFSEPFEISETLTPEEVASSLARVPEVREWLKAFEEAALTMAYSQGIEIPGYKVVMSGGKRSFIDPEGAVTFLTEIEGYSLGQVARTTPKTLGDLEKLLGVQEFATIMAPFLKKGEGQPSLVLESDKRPSINPHSEAIKEFSE
jgi:hypothetical protein